MNAMTVGVRGVNQFQLLRLISLINRGNGSEGRHRSRSENTKVLCVKASERKNRVLSKSRECGKNTLGGYHLYNF